MYPATYRKTLSKNASILPNTSPILAMGALTTAIMTPETMPMTLSRECVLNEEVA